LSYASLEASLLLCVSTEWCIAIVNQTEWTPFTFTLRATRDLKIGVQKNPNLAKSGV
jgi:hypothetical protein